jgi:hypothetical protein
LYFTSEDYMLKLEMLVTGNLKMKKNKEECLRFIGENTWSDRVVQMMAVLN